MFNVSATAELQDGIGNSGTIRGISFVNAQTGWAVGDRGLIVYTTTGGRSWTIQHCNPLHDFQDVVADEFAINVWAVALDGRICSTSNSGANWTDSGR
eukprot:1179951-Prorocentrum_minimum.AAC.6